MKKKSTKLPQSAIDWHERRKRGIGGSDVAAILGLSPYQSAMDVWMAKKGITTPTRDTNREFLLTLGKELEPVIAKCYERETRRLLVPGGFPWEHKKYPCLLASPDRFTEDLARGVELKSENQFQHQFGDPGSNEVPIHYALQCVHYMAVCDVEQWDVAVLHGGARFAVYTLHRDRELEEAIIERLLTWWGKHLIDDKPPEVDSSAAWLAYVKKKFPADIRPIATADVEADQLLKQLNWLRIASSTIEEMLSTVETRVKLRIGDHTGLQGHWGTATWKRTKDINRIDWKAAITRLQPILPHAALAQALQDSTTTEPGTRRFLFKGRDEDGNRRNQAGEAIKRYLAEIGIGAGVGQLDGDSARGSASESALPLRGTSPEGPGHGAPELAEGSETASVRAGSEISETNREGS